MPERYPPLPSSDDDDQLDDVAIEGPHMRDGEGPHACSVCDFRTPFSWRLAAHRRVHLGTMGLASDFQARRKPNR